MTTNHKQLPSTLFRPFASPPSSRVEAVMSIRSMQQLLNQIEQIKIEVEDRVRPLKKIDTGRKKIITNRDHSVEGRTQIKNLTEHIINLQKQLNLMTKESDPNWPTKTFDKSKQNALKTLSTLLNQLNKVDRHLEKATSAIPTTMEGMYTRKAASYAIDIRRTPSLSDSEEETTSETEEEDESEYAATHKKPGKVIVISFEIYLYL